MRTRRGVVIGLWCALALTTGCFAEISGGAYRISQEGAVAGQEVEESAYSIGIALGIQLDFWQKVRLSAGWGGEPIFMKGKAGGTAGVNPHATFLRADVVGLTLSDRRHYSLMGTVVYIGGGSGDFTPEGATEPSMDANGDTSQYFLGGTLAHYVDEPALAKWAQHLSVGLVFGSHDGAANGLGDVSWFGAQARFSVSWAPYVVPGLTKIGGGGGGGGGRSAFVVDMPGSDNVLGGLASAMRNSGCTDVGPNEAGGVVGNCQGVRVGVIQSGSQLLVACDTSSEATCRSTFANILSNAR